MNEALELNAGYRILEIGAGCGWHAATVAEIVAPSDLPKEKWGHVYTVEIVSHLADLARKNIKNTGYDDRITIIFGDGSLGYTEMSPYDRALVTAAAPEIPRPLVEQLKDGGILVIPVGGVYLYQTLLRIRKQNNRIIEENLGSVAFVPLTGRHGHKFEGP